MKCHQQNLQTACKYNSVLAANLDHSGTLCALASKLPHGRAPSLTLQVAPLLSDLALCDKRRPPRRWL